MPENKPVAGKAPKEFSLGRVLLIVIPLAIIVFGIFVGNAFFDFQTTVSNMFKPKLVPVKGVVYWNDKILEGAEIRTQHEDKTLRGASGFVKSDGTFTLETMVNGDFKSGVYPGKHKVIVKQIDRTAQGGPFQPPPSTPEKYMDFATSDLVLDISKSGDNSKHRLEMTGKGPKGQDNSKPPPEETAAAQPQVDPVEAAKEAFANADQDMDGKLSADEQGRIGTYARGMLYADENKDGFVDQQEFETMVRQSTGN